MDFNQPIPGQSLTVEPRKYPYERPPEINDPEEAVQMHLDRLSDPEKMAALVDAVEIDPEEMDVVTLTNGILRSAVATGLHSIDVSLVVAPVIHEFIKQTLDKAGVKYEEGLVDKKQLEKNQRKISKAKAERLVQEALKEADEPAKDKETDSPKETSGLMKRRA